MKKEFKWIRWHDPLGNNPPPQYNEEDRWGRGLPVCTMEVEDDDDDDDEWEGRVLMTHFGMLPLHDGLTAGNKFRFWELHTNFDLSNDIIREIEKTPGVELSMPLSRYRIRLGFPISGFFDDDTIKNCVERNILKFMKYNKQIMSVAGAWEWDIEKVYKLRELLDDLKQYGVVWAVYVAPNGHVDVTRSADISEAFEERLGIYSLCRQSVGGKVFTFMDDK